MPAAACSSGAKRAAFRPFAPGRSGLTFLGATMFMPLFTASLICTFILGFLAGNWRHEMAAKDWKKLQILNDEMKAKIKDLEALNEQSI